MTCNIDRTGRTRRIWIGVATLALAPLLAVLVSTGVLQHGAWWVAVVACVSGGAFCLFEGLMGWCAVRALGFQTPW